jgi:hypothetical protein
VKGCHLRRCHPARLHVPEATTAQEREGIEGGRGDNRACRKFRTRNSRVITDVVITDCVFEAPSSKLTRSLACACCPVAGPQIVEGDNRETGRPGGPVDGVADRVVLGLLPSSEGAWELGGRCLRGEGGWLHVHGNVGEGEEAGWTARMEVSGRSIVRM